jgi:predicted AAA+ superfamily ATPase
MFTRLLSLSKESYFLFGPRGVGKSTLLKSVGKFQLVITLLKHDLYLKYLTHPSTLRDQVLALKKGSWVWIDEVQKVPDLLDEVHFLIEEGYKFALSGSSARKLKKAGANLLAGRAITIYMDPLGFLEMKESWQVDDRVLWGNLPLVVNRSNIGKQTLRAYVNTYLKEEIQMEGHVRKLDPFIRFLAVAALMNAQIVNASSLAREAKVSRPSIEGYFSILVDTLIGCFVPAFQPRAKVKEVEHPKFYFFDSGVARATAGLLDESPDKDWLGYAFETMILHELRLRNHISDQEKKIMYYKVHSGREIDFVVETKKGSLRSIPEVILIESKYSNTWKKDWESEIIELAASPKIKVKKAFGVYCGSEVLQRGLITVLPVKVFLSKLYSNEIF